MTQRMEYRIADQASLRPIMMRVWEQVSCLVKSGQPIRMLVEEGDTRTSEQNAKMWAMLADVARQVNWHGQALTPEDWKHIFSAGLEQQRVAPNLDGNGFVVLGASTRSKSKKWFSDLFELMHAFGAERDIKWSAPEYGDVA